jgi:hypothetical protein
MPLLDSSPAALPFLNLSRVGFPSSDGRVGALLLLDRSLKVAAEFLLGCRTNGKRTDRLLMLMLFALRCAGIGLLDSAMAAVCSSWS